jgi:hypothetical protein
MPIILTDTSDASFDKVSMDMMGPLPISPIGNSYILTIQDLLTKYLIIVPMRDASAVSIAEAFTDEFVCLYGSPKALLTDKGAHFLNSLIRIIARKFRIKHYKITAYRPQSNESVEHSHYVIWEHLKQFTTNDNWDEYLKLAASLTIRVCMREHATPPTN